MKKTPKNPVSIAQSSSKLPVQPASSACNYLHIYHEKKMFLDNMAIRGQNANWVWICSNSVKHGSYTAPHIKAKGADI